MLLITPRLLLRTMQTQQGTTRDLGRCWQRAGRIQKSTGLSEPTGQTTFQGLTQNPSLPHLSQPGCSSPLPLLRPPKQPHHHEMQSKYAPWAKQEGSSFILASNFQIRG